MSSSRGFPPFPVTPDTGPPESLQVQFMDPRVFQVLGIDARRGYSPQLLPFVVPVVTIPLSEVEGGSGGAAGSASGFIGGAVRTPATQMQIQLYNPVGSNTNLFLDRITFSMGSPGIGQLNFGAVALANLEMQGAAKALSSPAAAGAVRYESNAAVFGTPVSYFDAAAGGVYYDYDLAEPIIIPPGQGVNVRNPTAASRLACNFEWRESPL